jgi:hypothetical protein
VCYLRAGVLLAGDSFGNAVGLGLCQEPVQDLHERLLLSVRIHGDQFGGLGSQKLCVKGAIIAVGAIVVHAGDEIRR